jgi:polyhydroxyalkanoate synthesis regulator phasin
VGGLNRSSNAMRLLKLIVPCLALSTVATSAIAQDQPPKREGGGGGGQPPTGERPQRGQGPAALSPEKAKAAWELQAQGVAKRLGFSEEQTKAVVKAYAEARESQSKATQKLRDDMREKMQDESADRRAVMAEQQKAIEELNKTERSKLEAAITKATSAEQATKAVTSLGTFNRQWDLMASTIAGFNLDAAKQQPALDAIETFVVAQSANVRQGPDADREAARTAMQETRQKLTDALAKVLSEDQMKAFEEATRGGRGAGRGGPPEGDRPRRNRDE